MNSVTKTIEGCFRRLAVERENFVVCFFVAFVVRKRIQSAITSSTYWSEQIESPLLEFTR